MIELVENKNHSVLKRNGKIERYNKKKLEKVLLWACKGNKNLVKEILNDINIKIYDKILITRLFNEVINTVANKINLMYPIWDEVAKNLYIQKIYKDVWGIKRDTYPKYTDVVAKGIRNRVYNKEIINTFTDDELNTLGTYIKQERDFNFSFGGINLFMDKYSMKYTKTKWLELPQHSYMRVAIQLHYKDTDRLAKIKAKYDMLSTHKIVVATPILLNSLRDTFNATSCVLIQVDDDSESIMEAARSMAMYSKNASGLGVDVSRIRSVGSVIGKDGKSSGVIPFIKLLEGVVSSFNQMAARAGAAAIYFPWWNYEVLDLLMLKDAGGSDDKRARKLKYALKWDEMFSLAIKEDADVCLFDPVDTPMLLETYGEEFVKWYKYYVNSSIRRKVVKAREIAYLFLKVRAETGNEYWFSVDNANKFNIGSGFINQGNLCCAEVLLPTKPITLKTTQTSTVAGSIVETREYDGEIGICNLTSINLITWDKLTSKEKEEFTYNLLLGMDNAIEYADYPVKAGERFNRLHRAIGIGITNYHNWLASDKIRFTDDKALQRTHEVMEDIYYYLTYNSIRLAKERSKYTYFPDSKWEKGMFGWELYEKHFTCIEKELGVTLNYPMQHNWEDLRKDMMQYGVRFEFLMSIPPGATSSLVTNFTEGIEAVRELFITKEGTYSLPFIAPNLKDNREYYDRAWDIPTKNILYLAAVRQKFLDQSQSLNIYEAQPDSAYSMLEYILLAEKLGLKSLYYFNSLKKHEEEQCDSCAV